MTDANAELLLEHGRKYFEDVRTKEQLFELLRVSLSEYSALFRSLIERGVITAEDVGRYQWASCISATFVRVLDLGPLYDMPALEEQLNNTLRELLATAPRESVTLKEEGNAIPECIRPPSTTLQ